MHPKSVVLLFRLFWLFIVRRVVGRGLLASPAARLSAIFLLVAAFAGFSVLSYVVIRQYLGGTGLLEPVLQVANASVGFWVLIAYTLIRVLFMKADELLKLSFNLPVTNKERTMAFALFESSLVLLVTAFVFGAFSISTVLIEGTDYIPRVLASIWFPAISTYLLLSLGYYLLERALQAIGIARLRGLVVPMVLAIGLAVAFPQTNEQSSQIAESYVSGREYNAPILLYAKLQEDVGLWFSILVLLATSAAMIPAIVVTAPRNYVPMRRFFVVLPSWLAGRKFGVYILVLFRSFETMVAFSFILIYSVFAWFEHLVLPPYVLALITFQGVYAFSNSEPLRRMATYPGRTVANYLRLVGSQGVLLVVVGVPVIGLSVAQGVPFEACLPVLGFCLSNILISTLVGIAFPPEKGNPFTVIIGVLLTLVLVMIVALGLNVFNFEPITNTAIFTALNLLVVFYSILGMRRMERIARNEVVA
ncbi:hypothetical protein [Arthrobacter bambusae]|uniref:hypothetical protein n=1 Tax=Arthrobacter bambusae TaxID=1338426 RepID=UPI0027880DA3|nr:hypothetical protein [Arthrobacter bambusae]MDQ0029344.1 hypothetical protein [Arthrobacter bambusae]MDQ0098253.1 hypothetical protein [Arthrobacter bambusae]